MRPGCMRSVTGTTSDCSGRVLIVGGMGQRDDWNVSQTSAEIFDPLTETFSVIGDLTAARKGHIGTLLSNGSVLINGGHLTEGPIGNEETITRVKLSELYDPVTDSFEVISEGPTAGSAQAALLGNGNVLIVGNDREALLFVSSRRQGFDNWWRI